MTATWNVAAPNLGYLLRDGGQCVGAVLALYSERLIGGRLERFCNIGTWCVAESYRAQSLALISAVLNQDGYHFTVLSPNEGPQEILPWLKFRFLDTAAVLVPNLPLVNLDPIVMTAVAAEARMLGCEGCEEELEEFGAFYYNVFSLPSQYLMCREPVSSLAELEGKKVRVTGVLGRMLAKA